MITSPEGRIQQRRHSDLGKVRTCHPDFRGPQDVPAGDTTKEVVLVSAKEPRLGHKGILSELGCVDHDAIHYRCGSDVKRSLS